MTMGSHAMTDILISSDSYPGSGQDGYFVTAGYVNAVSGAIGGGGSPGGSDGQVQYNNGGSFGGESTFVYDDTNNRVGIGTTAPNNLLNVSGGITAFDNGTSAAIWLYNAGTAAMQFSITGTERDGLIRATNKLYLMSTGGDGDNEIILQSAGTTSVRISGTSCNYILPTATPGGDAYPLTGNADGSTGWASSLPYMGGSIADTQIAYGNGTAIAGEAAFTYNDSTNKLTVSSADINTITGETINLDAGVYGSFNFGSHQTTLTSILTSAAVGPVLSLFRDSASPLNNDYLGQIEWTADINATGEMQVGSILQRVLDVTQSSENTTMHFSSLANGAAKVLQWGSLGTGADFALYPSNDDAADLGGGGNQWKNIYGTGFWSNGVEGASAIDGGTGNPQAFTITVGSHVYAFDATKGIVTSMVDNNLSDENLKENISVVDKGLSLINQLEPKRFKFIEGFRQEKKLPDESYVGYIAQDIEKISPDYVNKVYEYDGEKYLGIEDEFSQDLQAALVNAIKELSAKNDALEARLTALEG
jgi:hypothetical protein